MKFNFRTGLFVFALCVSVLLFFAFIISMCEHSLSGMLISGISLAVSMFVAGGIGDTEDD